MNVIEQIKSNYERFPQKTAIIDEDRKISFKELYNEVENFALPFNTHRNDVVSIISENSLSFIISYLGIIKSGLIAHLVPTHVSEDNLVNQITSSASKGIICSNDIFNKISKFSKIKTPILKLTDLKPKKKTKNNIMPNDIAYLIYTSGTTNIPKGVPITHEMIEFTTNNIIHILRYKKSDVDLLPLPLYHSFGLGCLHTSLFVGTTLILQKNASDLHSVLNNLTNYNVTTFASIPATLTKLLTINSEKLEDSFSKVRVVITNSTHIPENTVKQFVQILKNGKLSTYYGLTEASRSTFMTFTKNLERTNSVGIAAPGVEIKILNDENENMNEGEIWIKGKNVIKKYWLNKNADKNIVDGWIRTGDFGYFDEKKYLFLRGRKDDLINIGGEKVFPEEVEDVVRHIVGVKDVVAFGVNHDIFGQVIKIHVIKEKNTDVDKSKILVHCMKNLEKFKVPSKIEFVENIPRTDYGKVKRFMLK